MAEENEPTVRPDRPFYDIFISYRHRDAGAVDQLAAHIEALGYEVFVDSHFSGLNDPNEIKRDTIETIRQHIAKATCLIVAYSRESAKKDVAKGEPVGVWMPWELGYFDGAITSRIAVYLLDGPRDEEDDKNFYKGCEYLQLYEEITQADLLAYLARMAVRERRIDNTGSAFMWMEHLARECVANPANVFLGMAEWFTDHAANGFKAVGNTPMAEVCARTKIGLDELRVGMVRAWRVPLFDDLRKDSLQSMALQWMRQLAQVGWPADLPQIQAVTVAPGPGLITPQASFRLPADLVAEVARAMANATLPASAISSSDAQVVTTLSPLRKKPS
jgi:hypothetical protein